MSDRTEHHERMVRFAYYLGMATNQLDKKRVDFLKSAGYDIVPVMKELETWLEAERDKAARVGPFAQLYYTWDELEILANLVEGEVATIDKFVAGHHDADWQKFSSLRTSLREGQETVRRELSSPE